MIDFLKFVNQSDEDKYNMLLEGQAENQQLKDKLKWYEKENTHNQEIIIKQESTLKKIKHILNNQMDYREFVDIVNAIEDVLKEDDVK